MGGGAAAPVIRAGRGRAAQGGARPLQRDAVPVSSLQAIDGVCRAEIRDRVAAACEGWGIFQVVDHGVDADLIADMTRLSREFFALPAEDKLRYDMSGGKKGGFIVSSHLQVYTHLFFLFWRVHTHMHAMPGKMI